MTVAELRDKLAGVSETVLAVFCERAANSGCVDDATAQRLRELKQEWVKLEARATPADYNTYQQIQTEKTAVKARMVELLCTIPAVATKIAVKAGR